MQNYIMIVLSEQNHACNAEINHNYPQKFLKNSKTETIQSYSRFFQWQVELVPGLYMGQALSEDINVIREIH